MLMSNTVPTKMSFTGNAAANPAIRAANIPSQNTELYLLKGFAFNLLHGERAPSLITLKLT